MRTQPFLGVIDSRPMLSPFMLNLRRFYRTSLIEVASQLCIQQCTHDTNGTGNRSDHKGALSSINKRTQEHY
eukprot:4393159-Amphidinium_carterae.2